MTYSVDIANLLHVHRAPYLPLVSKTSMRNSGIPSKYALVRVGDLQYQLENLHQDNYGHCVYIGNPHLHHNQSP